MSTTKLWFTFTIAALVAAIQADGSNKRIPSGFLGMRGKKSIDFSGLDDPYAYNMLDNSPVYMEPLDRNRDDMFFGYSDHFNPLKRAPKGFQGMRGKKNYPMDTGPTYEELFAEDLEKRAMGFQGMRGKREYEYAPLAYLDKRGPIGFQGMRGKKSELLSKEFMHAFDEHITEDPLKKEGDNKDDKTLEMEQPNGIDSGDMSTRQRRASNMGFFGVRGKKMPSSTSSFFGMRGKKGPYDYPFRGKFVGVRGKKMYQEGPGEMQYLAGGMPWDSDSFEKRKGPSGFMGMRGKKWVNSETELSQADNANNGNGEE